MKQNFILCLIATFLLGLSFNKGNAQQVYEYHFLNNMTEEGGVGPDLNVLGTGAFINQALPEVSCLLRPVYNFDQNGGVSFDNTAAGNFITESYTIELYFQYLSNTGFRRIIDFKNRTSDFGLYSTSSQLQFYDAITLNTTSFTASQYVHLVVTRDSATQLVNLFVDGVIAGSFTDATELGLLDNDNVLNFFQDDLVFGGEAQPGTISLLKLYDQPLSDTQVADNFAAIKATSGIVSFEISAPSYCLDNNLVDFTNLSVNTSAVTYTWDFGDSTSATGLNASHTYGASGTYNVTMVADDGAGCTDTVFSSIEIYSQPSVSLGSDISLCDGDSALLDAGSGFSSYLWNDSTSLQNLTVISSGEYIVSVTDSNNCAATDSILVTVNTPLAFDLGADTTLCFGDSIIIAAPSGQVAYTWSTSDTTETISVGSSGVFAVEITNTDGCISSDTIEVTVNPELLITLGADTTLCFGDTLLLDAGSSFQSYLWNDNSVNQTFSVTDSGTYSVNVIDSAGCSATDSVSVIVNPLPVVDLGPDTFFCGGNAFALDAGSGWTEYLWNDGSSQQTLVIFTAGLYTVTVTDSTGCEGTDEVILGINPSITLGNDINLCDGDTAILDPGAGFAIYLWDGGASTQTLEVTSSATYTVTVTDSTGCVNTDEIIVTFVPQPVVNLGNDINMCSGSAAFLDAGPGFVSYLWNDSSTFQTFVTSQSGTYFVTVTNIGGCTATDTVTVNVNLSPDVNLGNDTTLCDGEQLVLDAGPGFVTYQWINGSTQQTLTVTSTNNYFVQVTDTNNCTGSDDIDVIFLPPVPQPTITQQGNTLYSSSPSGNQWYSNPGGLIPGATDTSYSPPQDGIYYVIVTDANGCESIASTNFNFVIDAIGENPEFLFSLYPNPANNSVMIVVPQIQGKMTMEIMDVTGRVVHTENLNVERTLVDVSQLTGGTYMVRLNGSTVQRLVITGK